MTEKKIGHTDVAIRAGLTLLVTACASIFATRREFYLEALVNPFFGSCLASLAILHLRVRPKWMDAMLVALFAGVAGLVDFRLLRFPVQPMAWLSFVGVGSLVVLGARAIWEDRSERRLLLYAWIPALLFVASEWFASDMLDWVAKAHPKVLDLYLLSFDASSHVQWSFFVGQAFARWNWLRRPGMFCYVGLAVPIALVYAGRLVRQGQKAFPAMLAFLVTGPIGILCYCIFPACGPLHVAHQFFPFHPVSIAIMGRLRLEPIAIEGARNAIPSLHLAWTLLAWWYSRGLSWWERSIAFLFLAFTAIATLGTGEHYLIDLVVAFPFALFIQALCAYDLQWNDAARVQAWAFGFGTTILWFVALRYANHFFWTSPIVPGTLVVGTIVLAELRRRALQSASEGKQRREMSLASNTSEMDSKAASVRARGSEVHA
jgi:PAP2 superfamily